MTIQELINALQALPEDLKARPVVVWSWLNDENIEPLLVEAQHIDLATGIPDTVGII